MKTTRKIMIVLGAMIVLFGLMGCGKNENEEKKEVREKEAKSIVGKWQQVETEKEPQIIEFLKDERVLIYDLKDIDKKEEKGLPGDYRFLDEKRVRMNLALFGPIDAEISPSGNEMILTSPFGKVEKYQKLDGGDIPTKDTPFEKVVPEKKTAILKVVFSRGVFQVGDFSVALGSVEREPSRTNLNFAITKVRKTGAEIEPLAITLADDHQNNYYCQLDITPYDDFPFHLLPIDFTYAKTASITMPKVAPIETIQIENTEKIAFKKLKLVKPLFKADFRETISQIGKSTQVGKFLFFTINGIVPDLYTWALELTIENKEYNELKGAVQSAVQFKDGRISPIGKPVIQEINGLSKEKVRLSLEPLRGQEVSQPVTMLVFYQDCSSGQTVLKLWPISEKNLPPRVGQGANEKIFIEAYQRNGGRQALGDPKGLPHWLAGGDKSKDEFDALVQEFPMSVIIWDKQKRASSAYVLHGAVLKKYQEPEIYRNLGPPTDDLKSWESSFGTKGVYGTFENGMITSRAGQTLIVMGKIYKKLKEENFIKGPLGFPVSDEIEVTSGAQGFDTTGRAQRFEGGFICLITEGEKAGQVSKISGAIANAYSALGVETSWLGFPISEPYQSLGLKPADQMEFEGGYIGSRDGEKWKAFPHEKGLMAFVSNRDRNQEIYVMEANGRNQINLTNNPADDSSPAWSPDGNRIVFESKRSGNWSIYVMDADGSNLRKLTDDKMSVSPAWFPDGLKIAFCSVAGTYDNRPVLGIFTMNEDGTNRTLLWKGFGIDPAVSPDGGKIAFGELNSLHGKTTQMWMMNSDGTGGRRVNIGLYSPAGFSWSPSGEAVVFYLPNLWANNVGLAEGEAIGAIDPRREITVWLTNKFGKDPCFSPDGKWIAFSYKGGIYIMDINGSLGRKIIGNTEGQNWGPSWTAGKQEKKTQVVSKETTEITIPSTEISEANIAEVNIPGKYILEEIDSQGKILGREPGLMNFQEDGTIIGSYSGRWVVQGEQINLFEGSKKVGSGKLLARAIVNWQVDDVLAWQTEKILKKEEAEMLRKGPEWIVVWSDYFFPENQSFGLKLQKDATFSMSGLLEEKWKIENGAVQIYKGEKKTDFTDGRLEGSNIVFKLKDGLVRLTRQN